MNGKSHSEIVLSENIILRALMLLSLYTVFYNYFGEHTQYFSDWTLQFHSFNTHIIAILKRF